MVLGQSYSSILYINAIKIINKVNIKHNKILLKSYTNRMQTNFIE